MAHKYDALILASQVKQVYYVQDQLNQRLSIVLLTPQKYFFNREDSNDLMINSIEHHPFIPTLAQVESFGAMDDSDTICIRGDCEGYCVRPDKIPISGKSAKS